MASVPPPAPRNPLDTASMPLWAVTLVRVLDDGLMIPGTRIGIGLDAVLGFLFPVLGDAATGVASLALLTLAFRMRVPKVVILRVVFNIALDALLGAVPLFGDVFDVFWRSNRRNLELLQRYDRDPARKPEAADYVIVGLGVLLVVASIVLPLVVGALLVRLIWSHI